MLLLDSGKLMANIQTIKSIPDSDQLVIDSGIRLDMEMMGLTEMGESVVLEWGTMDMFILNFLLLSVSYIHDSQLSGVDV